MAIQDRPVCFECEETIESLPETVFAPPFEDEAHRQISACFHPLCLMVWREKRRELREQMRRVNEAFVRHLTGECGCSES